MIRYISRDLNSDKVRLWHLPPRWAPAVKRYVNDNIGGLVGVASLADEDDTLRMFVDEYNLEPGQLINLSTGEIEQNHGVLKAEAMNPGMYRYLNDEGCNIRYVLVMNDHSVRAVWKDGSITRGGLSSFTSDNMELAAS